MSSLSRHRQRIPVVGVIAAEGATQNGLPATLVRQSYLSALLRSGAAPLLIPPALKGTMWPVVYSRLDGLLFIGGGDIAPQWYGADDHPARDRTDEPRDAIEIALCRAALEDGKPLLGICRGLQLLNVCRGGTLFADLAEQHDRRIRHDYPSPPWAPDHAAHRVELAEHSRLARIVGKRSLTVNSRHHQGVRETGRGLIPCGWAPDGVVEALEAENHPFALAVQWHPEALTAQPASRRLFRAFVEACALFAMAQEQCDEREP